jgi:hypothetical protein
MAKGLIIRPASTAKTGFHRHASRHGGQDGAQKCLEMFKKQA